MLQIRRTCRSKLLYLHVRMLPSKTTLCCWKKLNWLWKGKVAEVTQVRIKYGKTIPGTHSHHNFVTIKPSEFQMYLLSTDIEYMGNKVLQVNWCWDTDNPVMSWKVCFRCIQQWLVHRLHMIMKNVMFLWKSCQESIQYSEIFMATEGR